MTRAALARLLVAAGVAGLAWSGLTYASAAHRQEEATAAARAALRPAPREAELPEVAPAREGDVLGLIRIPAIHVRTAFFEGVADQTLLAGPGHLSATAPPGSAEVSVLSAHRDLHFRDLKDLDRCDLVVLRLPGDRIRYRVFDSRVVRPDDTAVTAPIGGGVLRLVTCWPPSILGPAPERLVVSAVPLHPHAGPVHAEPDVAYAPVVATAAARPAPWPGSAFVGAAGAATMAVASFAGRRYRRQCFLAWAAALAALHVSLAMLLH